MLKEAQEKLERKYRLEADGHDFKWLVGRMAKLLGLRPREELAPGKYPQTVKACSLLCYWETRELGITTVNLSRKLTISQPAVSQSAKRGEKIAHELGLCLNEKDDQ